MTHCIPDVRDGIDPCHNYPDTGNCLATLLLEGTHCCSVLFCHFFPYLSIREAGLGVM